MNKLVINMLTIYFREREKKRKNVMLESLHILRCRQHLLK